VVSCYDCGDNVLEETARREILEEVGVRVCPEPAYVRSVFFMDSDGVPSEH